MENKTELPDHITGEMDIGRRLIAVDPATGEEIKAVCAVHLKEGWLDAFEVNANGTPRVRDGHVEPVRKRIDFDLIDKETREKVASVRIADGK